MKAWRVHEYGAPGEVLRLDDVDMPEPGAGEVLVKHIDGVGLLDRDLFISGKTIS